MEGALSLGRQVVGNIFARGEQALASFSASGKFLPGAAAAFSPIGKGIAGVPLYHPIERIWVSQMGLRTNAEIYGTAGARTTVDPIPELMQRAGYSAEEMRAYKFVELDKRSYERLVAEREGAGFDASYGPNRISDTNTYSFKDHIAGRMRDGSEGPAIVRLRPGLLDSDEATIRAVAHEISEIEMAQDRMRIAVSGVNFRQWTSPKVNQNWHYQAIIDGDNAVLRFRQSIK